MSDDLGDRMKMYEMAEAGRKLMPLVPAIARIDGRCFSSFTRGMDRPYDQRMSDLMVDTLKWLVQETNACIGYTQSDEMTLVWYSDSIKSELFFGGRIQKICSVLAGMTAVRFNTHLDFFLLGNYISQQPHFDVRVWNVPNKMEAANCLLWRELDATKNSIGMAASSVYSHKELMGKHSGEKQEMLFQKGINWNDYPAFFKRGSFVQRRKTLRKCSANELASLPEKHEARSNPNLEIERTDYIVVDMPPFAKVTNRIEVVFDGAEPRLEGQPTVILCLPRYADIARKLISESEAEG